MNKKPDSDEPSQHVVAAYNSLVLGTQEPATDSSPAEAHGDALALAHRIAWRYKKSSDPHHSDTYTFNRDTLLQFAEAVRAAHPQPKTAEAHGNVLVPLAVLEDASSAIGNFVSDHGWGDSDMQAMDNLDAYIARHKANVAANVQPKGREAIERQSGPNQFKDWCAQWFGPDADDAYLARAVASFPAGQPTMGELPPQIAIDKAKAAMGYSQAFDGKGIDWQSGEPWPHRIELAQALDWITDLGAVILNLADRVVPPLVIQAPAPGDAPAAHVSSLESGSPLMCGLSEWESKGLVALYTRSAPCAAVGDCADLLEALVLMEDAQARIDSLPMFPTTYATEAARFKLFDARQAARAAIAARSHVPVQGSGT